MLFIKSFSIIRSWGDFLNDRFCRVDRANLLMFVSDFSEFKIPINLIVKESDFIKYDLPW